MTRQRSLEYDLLRSMSPLKKLDIMHALIRQAYEMKVAAIRASEPGLSNEEVLARIRETWARD